ncbi:MAG: hypothetical protein WBA46_04500, partial [Thermomicrobiales bacterium]
MIGPGTLRTVCGIVQWCAIPRISHSPRMTARLAKRPCPGTPQRGTSSGDARWRRTQSRAKATASRWGS